MWFVNSRVVHFLSSRLQTAGCAVRAERRCAYFVSLLSLSVASARVSQRRYAFWVCVHARTRASLIHLRACRDRKWGEVEGLLLVSTTRLTALVPAAGGFIRRVWVRVCVCGLMIRILLCVFARRESFGRARVLPVHTRPGICPQVWYKFCIAYITHTDCVVLWRCI